MHFVASKEKKTPKQRTKRIANKVRKTTSEQTKQCRISKQTRTCVWVKWWRRCSPATKCDGSLWSLTFPLCIFVPLNSYFVQRSCMLASCLLFFGIFFNFLLLVFFVFLLLFFFFWNSLILGVIFFTRCKLQVSFSCLSSSLVISLVFENKQHTKNENFALCLVVAFGVFSFFLFFHSYAHTSIEAHNGCTVNQVNFYFCVSLDFNQISVPKELNGNSTLWLVHCCHSWQINWFSFNFFLISMSYTRFLWC